MNTGKLTELGSLIGAEISGIVNTFIQSINLHNPVVNQWNYFGEKKTVKAIVLNTSNYKADVKEYHKEFADLHITVSGTDTMYFGTQVSEVIEDYKTEGDYSLVRSSTDVTVKIPPEHFVLIPPGEIHSSELSGEMPLKVVFKIKQNA